MKFDIKRALTNNIGIKLLAILFALSLWLVVVNVDDPEQTRSFTAVVTVVNDEALLNSGKYYEIKDGINTVTFRVTAKRSIIEKLSNSNFVAKADMNYLEAGTRVPVEVSAKEYAGNISISSKQLYLYVELENKLSNSYIVNAKTTGTPANGVVIDSVEVNPSLITITGREPEVEKIAYAEAVIDVDGMSADVTLGVMPVFYSADGEVVDVSGLELSNQLVDVTVNFVSMKTVDVSVRTSGQLSDDLVLSSITVDPVSIALKGEPQYLNDVTGITIPDSVINLSEVTGSFSTVVDICAYLPEGVSLVDSTQNMVTIYVNMEGEVSSTVAMPKSNITIANLASGLEATVTDGNVETHLFGNADALASFDKTQLTGYIDCTGLNAGEHTVVLHYDTIDGITVQNTTINIRITRVGGDSESKATPTPTPTEETTDDSTEPIDKPKATETPEPTKTTEAN